MRMFQTTYSNGKVYLFVLYDLVATRCQITRKVKKGKTKENRSKLHDDLFLIEGL